MERRKNLPVLPSNAPALSPRTSILSSQSEDLISPLPSQSNILRATTPLESSIFNTKFKSDNRHETNLASEHVNPPYHTAQAAIRLTQKKDRRNIWQRWELQSQRYVAYRRNRARSKKAGTKEDIWPDDVEEAFQIAIRLYAKRGKIKDELNGKQAGTNEFISDWIEKQTGHRRNRKQISSHIQTLKGFLRDVPAWMDLVTAFPPGKQEKSKVIKHGPNAYDELGLATFNSMEGERPMQQHGNLNPQLPPSVTLSSNDIQDPTIRSIQFDMHLSNSATRTRVHNYTSIQSGIGSAARTLEQIPQWQDMFPHLANRYYEGRIDCPLYFFESRLRLIDNIFPGLSLGVEFVIDFAEGAYFHNWRSLISVHKQNITPQYFDDSEFEETGDRLECIESNSGQSDIQLTIPFKSKWWVKLFSSIISKRGAARKAEDREAIKWAEGYPDAYLRELSIVQELWATPRQSSPQCKQRMATLLWTFSQTRNGEAATTTWRPITLSTSASPYQAQEPILHSMQASTDLDSALTESLGPVHSKSGQQQTPDFYNTHGHHGGLFSESSKILLSAQRSEDRSSPPTSILDYTSSFPSSTSTSFPSSVSNASGCYVSHHGSSFDSQDSTRSSYTQSLESSLHSQHSAHDPNFVYGMPQSITNNSLKPHNSNDGFPDSQDLLYTLQPGSVYGPLSDYPSSSFDLRRGINDATIIIDNTTNQRDFTVEALQYAYAGQQDPTTEEELSPTNAGGFQVPLIAPRANLLPVQQVGDCLQSFEAWVPEQGQPQQENLRHIKAEIDEGESEEEQVCGSGQRQSISYHHLFQSQQQNTFQSLPQQEQQEPPRLHSPFPVVYQSGELQRQQHDEQENTLTPNDGRRSTDDDDGHDQDEETQRQQQLQYLHDTQDHWQQSFHSSALWTTVSGADDGAMLDNVIEEPQPQPQPQQLLEHGQQGKLMLGKTSRERIRGMEVVDDDDDDDDDDDGGWVEEGDNRRESMGWEEGGEGEGEGSLIDDEQVMGRDGEV